MPNGFLLINQRSGSGDGAAELVAAARERGIQTHVLQPGDDALELLRAAGADVVGVAGGDGSLGAGAQVAFENGTPFVCVPFGTRNHFARDLGLDLDDPVGALAAFTVGHERRVDVVSASGRVYLNNLSIGAYAQAVHEDAGGSARLRAILAALRSPQRLLIDGAPVDARVALFANNAYRVDGVRETLEEGVLHLYVAHGLLHTSWEERTATSFTVTGTTDPLEVAIDGEPIRMPAPIELEIQPRALRVLVPAPPE